MYRVNISLAPTLFFVCAALLGAEGAPEFTQRVTPFLKEHCFDCHGPEVQKSKFRLDTLTGDFAAPDCAERWIKVFDKISAGQMPPASQPRPKPDEIKPVAAFLQTQLHDASLARQQREGRVLLRRLNRTEYQNTLRDLLQINLDVDDLLPDDNVAFGFDNVSTALDLSSSHFLHYQDVSERALGAAVPYRIPANFKERRVGKEIADKNPGIASALNKWLQVRDGALVLFARMPLFHSIFSYPYGMQLGTYRLRFCASAINTSGKTLPVSVVRIRDATREDGEALGCFDVPAGAPAEFAQEFVLRPRERIQLCGWTLPSEGEFNNKHKNGAPPDYAGPGVAVQWVEVEGPLESFPGEGYRRLFGDLPLKALSVVDAERAHKPAPKISPRRGDDECKRDPLVPVSNDPRADSEKLLRSFLPLAFRRPVDAQTVSYFQNFALERIDKGYYFGEAMLAAYKAALCSPHFLLLEARPGRLDDYALAERLSYFIWRSMPDAELIALAKDGKLHEAEILHAQLERLLKDPKGQRFVSDFTGQWLDMHKINATSPDPQLYGEFDQYLLWSMPRETELFFDEILRENLSINQFVDSDWTFANERLAQHYGLSGISGSGLRRVTLPAGTHRGGVLTHASVLKVTADGTRTSPILRGKWILDRIVGKPPSPPPPDIPAIEPDIRGATTIRQQLEKHRNTKACATCHVFIDPPGFALETYDPIGGWRDFYRISKSNGKKVDLANYPGRTAWKGPAVEMGYTTPDGRIFKDLDEYKKILLEERSQLTRNLVQKLTIYSTGAGVQFADREVVEQIVAKVGGAGNGLRTIVHEIVGSRVFQNK